MGSSLKINIHIIPCFARSNASSSISFLFFRIKTARRSTRLFPYENTCFRRLSILLFLPFHRSFPSPAWRAKITPMRSPPSPLDQIHLHDINPEDEADVLKRMAEFGLDAFEDTCEERVYPFNELTRLGLRQAAELAAHLGDTVWARDDCGDAAADHLARQKREEELVVLLKTRPPRPENPWAADGLQRLWELCCENGLFQAMDQLALMASPGLGPWKAAAAPTRAYRMLSVMAKASGSAQKTHPQALALCAQANMGEEAMAVITGYPDFNPERFRNPWPEAAARADARLLVKMTQMGLPPAGWSEREGWGPTAWEALADRKFVFEGQEIEAGAALFKAGILPGASDLQTALRTGRERLADQMELYGALPDARCAELAFEEPVKAKQGPDLKAPTERLWRWLASGALDFLEPAPPRAIGYWGSRGHSLRWAADALMAAGSAPKERLPELAQMVRSALSASPRWDSEQSQKLLFDRYESAGYKNRVMMARLAQSLGAGPAVFETGPQDLALETWWRRAVMELSVPAAPASKRAPSL